MRALLCIDDTDNLESIGTGEVLQNLCALLEEKGLAKGGFVSRHQLFIHENIAYTSHNSSMCSELKMDAVRLPELIAVCQDFLETNCAEGSDPGLCVVDLDALGDSDRLVAFGRSAKEKVLTKAEAYAMAASYAGSVYLSEHGGTGDGIIGALAGCGLRISGTDGKIKGKLHPTVDTVMTADDFCRQYGVDAVLDTNRSPIDGNDTLRCVDEIKPVVWGSKAAILVKPDEKQMAKWQPLTKKEVRI